MLDFFKDGFEAFGQRIRSPFLGSIALVFIYVNWKPIAYVLFADISMKDRFKYFDEETTNVSLYAMPIIIGVIFALVSPWLKFAGAYIAKFPKKRLDKLQHDEAQIQRIYKFEQSAAEERALAELEEAKERRIIEASKRDKEARDTGQNAEEGIKASRSEKQSTKDQYGLSEIQKLIIETLGSEEGGMQPHHFVEKNEFLHKANEFTSNFSRKRLSVDTENALGVLRSKKLVSLTNKGTYSLTSIGYGVLDSLADDDKATS